MRAPEPARFLLKVLACRRNKAYLGDVEEIYRQRAESLGPELADRWYRREALRSLPRFALESIRWRMIMFKNYLKTAARLFRRDAGYSFLNMSGLAIGLACFVLLMLWVRDEVGWDRFHEDSSLIYRVESNLVSQPAPLGPYLKANYPDIAASTRLWSSPVLIKCGDKSFNEGGFALADPSIFDVFTVPFVAGNRSSALTEPNSVVLTEAAAAKYFGTEDPLGRVLTVENRFDVRVTGVVRNPPGNSDLQFDVLGEFRILGRFRPGYETHWGNHEYTTYVRLAAGAAAPAVEAKIARVVIDHAHDPSLPLLSMTPIGRIHLYKDGAITYVTIFALVAVFILAIAACNFINLTTARSGRRAKEIAVRKVAGAIRHQLIGQFLSETVMLSLGAFLLALSAVALVLPFFNAVTAKHFGLSDLFRPDFFLSLLGLVAATGVLSGAYPAFLLSSFRPAGLLKGGGQSSGRPSGGSRLRKVLVVVQFAISTVLLISALLIQKQLTFLRHYDLGIRTENVVVLRAKEPLIKSREAFVSELVRHPGIVNATFVSSLPMNVNNVADGMTWEGMDAGRKPVWLFTGADDRYLDTLGLTLVEGRNFPDGKTVTEVPYFLVNEKAAAEMNVKSPVGARFSMWGWNGTVIGVVKNFHVRPLREDIQPLLVFVFPRVYQYILVKIQREGGDAPEILGRVKRVWDRYAPGTPFEYEFLDAAYGQVYRNEQKTGQEFRYFSFLGIFISCLGLVGLAAYIAERKRKEIGIRKVLGASLPGILRQINAEFLGPILVSNLVAWPAAYWAVRTWLAGFAFHATIPLWVFVASAASALAVGLLTVSFQSLKAARENPATSLKSE